MVLGGASIRRLTDPATDGLTDDRIRRGGGKEKTRTHQPTGGPGYLLFSELTASTTEVQLPSTQPHQVEGENFLQVIRINHRGPLCLQTRKLPIYGPCL